MKYILFVGLLMYLFISDSVSASFGIGQVALWSSSVLFILSILKFFQIENKYDLTKNKIEIKIIILGLIVIVIKCLLLQFDQIRNTILFFILPMLFSIFFKDQNDSIKKSCRNIILLFFIANCLLAIYERFYFVNIFPYKDLEESFIVEDGFFRSTSLLGHPLNNSLIISTIMAFILNANLKDSAKFICILLGFISLLCFNARFAIILWIILIPLYLIHRLKNRNEKSISIYLTIPLVSLIIFVLFKLVVDFDLGARLFKNQIFDGSAITRITVYNSINLIDFNTYIFGDSNQYLKIMNKLKTAGVENSLIVFIIKYGLLFFGVSVVFYYQFFKNKLRNFDLFRKFILISAFIVLGLSNNGLVNPSVWGVFVIGICCFAPINKNTVHKAT